MGLAGRKQKQRIPADPRNLSWADDASRFGRSYLSKFGWDASQGLGSSADGVKTHLKVQQKLDMMGIGGQHQRDPNGIAWKQNKEFEALLKRLNERAEHDSEDKKEWEQETAMGGAFVRAQEEKEKAKGALENEASVTTKKRKHESGDDVKTSVKARKKKKHQKSSSSSDDFAAPAIGSTSEVDPPLAPSSSVPNAESIPTSKPKPRLLAHRARIRAAKSIANKSASAISEILGIAPSSTASTSASTPEVPTPSSTPTDPPLLSLGTLTTSAKSVADYFKEKLVARSSSSLLSTPSGSATPAMGLGSSHAHAAPSDIDESELPRRGIGSRAPAPIVEADADADGRDMVTNIDMPTEKQRRKAERKAEKQKRRTAEAKLEPEDDGVSTDVKEGKEKADDGRTLEERKRKRGKRRDRKVQAPTDPPNNDHADMADKHHEHDAPIPDAKVNKRSEKERKKKRS